MPRLSFILPVLNEAALITRQLQALQDYRQAGHEVIVVDGGSTDTTLAHIGDLADQVLTSAAGRSVQMNAGAQQAQGDILVFLHTDTTLPPAADRLIHQALTESGAQWGWFNVRLSHSGWPYRVIAFCMNLRTRLTFVCTGDQALFVRRTLFQDIGGFPPLPLMEDVAISKLLRRRGVPGWVVQPATASSRRWETRGLVRTVLLMWWLRLLYVAGVSPARLQRLYYPHHGDSATEQP